MTRKLTQQEFEESIRKLYGEEVTILGEYKGRREKVLVRHNCELCENHEWDILAGNLFGSISCPKCHDINRRKGTEEFKKEVEETTNREYLFIDEYKNNKTLSKFYHVTCDREFMKRPNEFVTGQRCPYCELENRGINTRKSHDEFLKQCESLPNFNEYEIIGTYERSDIKIEIYHKVCKKTFWITPNNFLKGVRCSHCYKTINKTTEEIRKEIDEKTSGEYSLIGEYINSTTDVLIRHNKCKHEWWTKAKYIIEGHGCEKCFGNLKKSDEEFKRELHDKFNGEIIALEEYNGRNEKILFKHITEDCGHEWKAKSYDILNSVYGCPICAVKNLRKTHEEFVKEIQTIHGSEIIILEEYNHSNEKIKVKHNSPDCGYHEWMTKPNTLRNGCSCPKCSSSKGEKKISKWLLKNNIHHQSEFPFDDLRGVRNGKLPFDFAILDDDKNVILLIEYDGLHHYKPVSFYGGEKGFATRVYHDALKNSYCEDNNIPLLRIPYWEKDNIEQILTEELSKYNLINIQQTQSA